MLNLVPRSFFELPRFPSLWDEDDNWFSGTQPSGLAVSEDQNHVYVEAQVPGVDPKNIEVTFDKGMLWIKGEQKEEEKDKNKKYYRRASSMFSYHVSVPGKIDEKLEPDAICKNGVMKVTFNKLPEVQPKKLTVKSE